MRPLGRVIIGQVEILHSIQVPIRFIVFQKNRRMTEHAYIRTHTHTHTNTTTYWVTVIQQQLSSAAFVVVVVILILYINAFGCRRTRDRCVCFFVLCFIFQKIETFDVVLNKKTKEDKIFIYIVSFSSERHTHTHIQQTKEKAKKNIIIINICTSRRRRMIGGRASTSNERRRSSRTFKRWSRCSTERCWTRATRSS